MDLPNVALSIRQPWAWLVANGHKDIENRDWKTNFRGPVLIHASLKIENEASYSLTDGAHPVTGLPVADLACEYVLAAKAGKVKRGGIIGVAEIVDCVSYSQSDWFVGDYGFVIRNARPLPFMQLKGALGFFKAQYVEPVVHAVTP